MPVQNEILAGTYQIIKEIGRGGTGIVYLAYHLHLRKNVVLKKIAVNTSNPEQLRRETDILKNLHHPFLPQVYDFIVHRNEVYTVMDYVEGNDMSTLQVGYGKISEAMLHKWFRQLSEVLDYLHSQRPPIIHSDIKPGNIILRPDGDICLIDFNISLGANQRGKVIGYSPNFASPEQIEMARTSKIGMQSPISLDARSDIYSLGATFYYFMTGYKPDPCKYTPPLSTMRGLPYMNGFMELIDKAMDKNRSRRFPSAKKMLSAMEHLRKQDIRYKKYVLLQVLSIFLVALFAAMGIFCIVRGAGAQKLTEYSEAFSGFLDAVDTKSSDAVIKDGLQLLNDQKFQDVFERQPQDRAQVLHALGDCYYEEEDYEGAQEKYEEAVSVLPESSSDIGYYYLDYAISLSKCGKSEQAETTLEKAGSLGVDTSSALLIEAGTRQLQGDKAGCEDAVNKLLKENSSISLCVKGCMMMVAMSDNPDEKVVWLEKAACYSSEAKIRRALGVSYVDCANEQSDIDEKKKFAGKALKCYQDLCKMENPTMEDRLGLAIVYHMLGQNDDSLKILKDCEQTDASDYRVSANMAFVYDSMNDSHNASMYCELAIRQISELADAKKQKAEDILSQLKTLRDKVAKEGVQP